MTTPFNSYAGLALFQIDASDSFEEYIALQRAGKRGLACTLIGAAFSDWLVHNLPELNITLVTYDNYVPSVRLGLCDAFVVDYPVGDILAAETCDVNLVGGPPLEYGPHDYALGVRGDREDVRDALSFWISYLRSCSPRDENSRCHNRFSMFSLHARWTTSTQCARLCGAGFAHDEARQACSPCEPGSSKALRGNDQACTPCAPGTYQPTQGQATCMPCHVGTHQQYAGATACTLCDHPTSSLPGSSRCDVCARAFVRDSADVMPTASSCRSCPTGASCPLNSTVASLQMQRGFWRLSTASAVIYECEDTDDGSTPCTGGNSSGALCREGHSGPLCEVCEAGLRFDRNNARCERCPERTGWLVAGVIVGSILLVTLALFGRSCLRLRCAQRCAAAALGSARAPGALAALRRLRATYVSVAGAVGLNTKLKLAFAFFSLVAAIDETYDANLPDSWTTQIESSFGWMRFDVFGLILSSSCLAAEPAAAFRRWLLLMSLPPLGIVALVALGVAVRMWMADACAARRGEGEEPLQDRSCARRLQSSRSRCCRRHCWSPFASSPPLAAASFAAGRACGTAASPPQPPAIASTARSPFCAPTPPSAARTRRTPRPSTSASRSSRGYSCSSGRWACSPCAPPPSSPAASPSSSTCTRHSYARPSSCTPTLWPSGTSGRSSSSRAARPSRGLVLLIGGQRPFLRLFVALNVSLFALVTLLIARPYRRPEDTVVAGAMHLALVCLYLGAMLCRLYRDYEPGAAQRVMGFDSVESIATPMLLAAFGMLALLLGVALRVLRQHSLLATIRLQQTRQPPKLSLPKHLRWSLFLSHCWQYPGVQEAVATIKRELQRLLPGVQIFLDVDDLEDTSKLEEYVAQSAVILLFVSRGYFSSVNCLREVVAATSQGKPIVLMHDPDRARGGGPIAELVAECDSKLAPLVFTTRREPIEWHRIPWHFQLISLKELAAQLLMHAPRHEPPGHQQQHGSSCQQHALEKPPLYVPGEVESQRLAFREGTDVYTSASNPGAGALAAAVQAAYPGLLVCDEALVARGRRGTIWRRSLGCRSDRASVDPGGAAPATSARPGARPSSRSRAGTVAAWLHRLSLPSGHAQMLLYLNDGFRLDGQAGSMLADALRTALADGVPIVLAHERDPQRGGCEFGECIQAAKDGAPDLLSRGLFKPIAVPFPAGPHRRASLALLAQALGARSERPSMPVALLRAGRDALKAGRDAAVGCCSHLVERKPHLNARSMGHRWVPRRRHASELLPSERLSSAAAAASDSSSSSMVGPQASAARRSRWEPGLGVTVEAM